MTITRFDEDRPAEQYEEEAARQLPFDKYDLDEEYRKHPQAYLNWAKMHAHAFALRREAELDLDKVKGDVDLDVRNDPEGYGLEAKTLKEAAVRAIVNSDDRVARAQARYLKVYRLEHLLGYIVKSFEQRKELLRGEGELWIRGYYSDVPPVRTEREGRKEHARHEVDDETGDKLAERKGKRKSLRGQ